MGRREKWPKKSWDEGEIGGESRVEEEKVGRRKFYCLVPPPSEEGEQKF